MIIYLDVIFLNHYVINRILLLWLQAFFPYQGSRIRKEAGLFFMALFQIPEEVLYLRDRGVTGIIFFELFAMLVLFIGIYRIRAITCFLRMLFTYLTGIFVLGGIFFGLSECAWGQRLMAYSKEHIILFYGLFIVLVCVVELFLTVAQKQLHMAAYEAKVEVWLEEKHFFLKGYMDSGNMLTDDLTGKPVLLGCYSAFEKYLSEEYRYIMHDFFMRGGKREGALLPDQKIRWMACSSVGAIDRVLPLLTVDKVRYVMNKRVIESVRQPVLLFDGGLMAGAYDVLLNKDI